MLRVYYSATESSWGTIPLKLKAALPASAIISVASKQSRLKKGKNFAVCFSRYNAQKEIESSTPSQSQSQSAKTQFQQFQQRLSTASGRLPRLTYKRSQSHSRREGAAVALSGYLSANSSDAGDGDGEGAGAGASGGGGDGDGDGDGDDDCDKVMKLKAPDVNTRIVWVTILERMISLYRQRLHSYTHLHD
jgi:hypothetical protein